VPWALVPEPCGVDVKGGTVIRSGRPQDENKMKMMVKRIFMGIGTATHMPTTKFSPNGHLRPPNPEMTPKNTVKN
jgi:hypothetical protein